MLNLLPQNVSKIFVHTGNILSLNEIKKLAGQNLTDELVESLKITLSDWQAKDKLNEQVTDTLKVFRSDEHSTLNSGTDRETLKVSVKVFVSLPKKGLLQEALEHVLLALKTNHVDSLVVACKLDSGSTLAGLQEMWTLIEEYVEKEKLSDVGVSDIDTDVFVEFYNWAKIKPSIIQINLAVCCVVPPKLQDFCKEKNVQLLTHSDPFEILPKSALHQAFGASDLDTLTLNWALRFQVHVKCRGVLANKGYLVCVTRRQSNNKDG